MKFTKSLPEGGGNCKGFAITSFLYSMLLIFLVIFSTIMLNMISGRLTVQKLKNEVKNKIESNNENTSIIEVIANDITILKGDTFNILEDVYLKGIDGTKIDVSINYTSTPTFDINKEGSYLIEYETTYLNKIYTKSRIIEVIDTPYYALKLIKEIDELESTTKELEDKIANNTNKINENTSSISSNKEELEDSINTSKEELTSKINTNKTELQTSINNLTNKSNDNNIFLQTYPVGSIYISTSSTNPGTIYGGTWERYGSGKTLVGVNESETEFATVNKTGGEKTHKLTINEMPSHNHNTWLWLNEEASSDFILRNDNQAYITPSIFNYGYERSTKDGKVVYGNPSNAGLTSSIGGFQAHNNLQPYITVYMFKRVS